MNLKNNNRAIPAIEFVGDERRQMNDSWEVPTANPNYRSMNLTNYPSTDAYERKLNFEYQKAQIDLMKQKCMHEQRQRSTAELQKLQIYNDVCKQMLTSTVYRDSLGDVIYSVSSPQNGTINSCRLLGVKEYRSCIFASYSPQTVKVLDVSWGLDKRDSLKIILTDEYSSTQFVKALGSKGVHLLVSDRGLRKAADALFAFTLADATEIEIPFTYGWNQTSDGKWHFTFPEDVTMTGVLKNVKG